MEFRFRSLFLGPRMQNEFQVTACMLQRSTLHVSAMVFSPLPACVSYVVGIVVSSTTLANYQDSWIRRSTDVASIQVAVLYDSQSSFGVVLFSRGSILGFLWARRAQHWPKIEPEETQTNLSGTLDTKRADHWALERNCRGGDHHGLHQGVQQPRCLLDTARKT